MTDVIENLNVKIALMEDNLKQGWTLPDKNKLKEEEKE